MEVKQAYSLFKRKHSKRAGVYYIEDNKTGQQLSLRTKDEAEAKRILSAKNHAANEPQLNLALGKAYLSAIDPQCATRTWQKVFDYLAGRGKETTRERWSRVMRSKPIVPLLAQPIIETTAADFSAVLGVGGNFTNHVLRQLQSTAFGMGWLHSPIIPLKLWPKTLKRAKRAITVEEHQKIVTAEKNDERRSYYQLLWETGASQSDGAYLTAETIDWKTRIIDFTRMKTGSHVHISIGDSLERLLNELPRQGFLFPNIALTDNKARAAEFCRRLRTVKVSGVSLHSYRYSWAERARTAGYPERFAQAALGHNSRAVHQSYARNAPVICPSLDEWEKKQTNILPLPQPTKPDEAKSA